MRHKNIVLSVLIFISISLYSQERKYIKEGKFDYGLIDENILYIPNRPLLNRKSASIIGKRLDLSSNKIYYTGSSMVDFLPFIWNIEQSGLYGMYYWRSGTGRRNAKIDYQFIGDTTTIVTQVGRELISRQLSVYPFSEYFIPYSIQYRRFEKEDIDKVEEKISFDFWITDSLRIYVCFRDYASLFVWFGDIKQGTNNIEWHEDVVYNSSHYKNDEILLKDFSCYSGTKTIANSITDTLFFDGHFKVLHQDGEKYIFNRQHGIIYHMGDSSIARIGTVLVGDNYPKIQGKPLFIEDRDHNRLIFFAPVEWDDTPLPKPNVYFMKEDEMREYFKYVMN